MNLSNIVQTITRDKNIDYNVFLLLLYSQFQLIKMIIKCKTSIYQNTGTFIFAHVTLLLLFLN